MQRAMAREAEAERERRAKVINARGELRPPGTAAGVRNPVEEPGVAAIALPADASGTGADQNSTVVFPAARRHSHTVPQRRPTDEHRGVAP